jgi:hypothetical protein
MVVNLSAQAKEKPTAPTEVKPRPKPKTKLSRARCTRHQIGVKTKNTPKMYLEKPLELQCNPSTLGREGTAFHTFQVCIVSHITPPLPAGRGGFFLMTTGRNTRLQIVHAARQCYCRPSRGGATRRLAASYTSRLASILGYQNRPRPAFPAPPRELFVAVGVAAAVHRARFMPDRLTVLALPHREHKRNITRNITGLSTVYPQDTQRTNARGSLHHGDTMGRLLASNRQGQCADTERRLRGYCATCDAEVRGTQAAEQAGRGAAQSTAGNHER